MLHRYLQLIWSQYQPYLHPTASRKTAGRQMTTAVTSSCCRVWNIHWSCPCPFWCETTQTRPESLLVSFSKLFLTISVETVNFCTVYWLLKDLYIVLITDKAPNILQVIETVQIFVHITNSFKIMKLLTKKYSMFISDRSDCQPASGAKSPHSWMVSLSRVVEAIIKLLKHIFLLTQIFQVWLPFEVPSINWSRKSPLNGLHKHWSSPMCS
jgi:hypothetical protein